MKIMQVIPAFAIGGAETMCENLVYELKALGHDVVVVSLESKETYITHRLIDRGFKIIYMDKKPGFDASMFYKLFKAFKQHRPDVIHTHLGVTRYVFFVATFLKIKVVHTIHNIASKDEIPLIRIVNKFFYKFFNVTPVALSEEVKKTIIDSYGLKEKKVPVVFNGIDLSKCKEKTDYSINGNFKILHIGRFVEQKNHTGLLNAFKMFHAEVNDSELWLVGDGEKREEIEAFINKNGLSECVNLFGFQKNSYEFLHNADIFALPSIFEGLPMTLIEAMGTGLPIVATAVGGVPDMLSENESQLVPVDDETISKSFKKYYDNFNLRERHGEAVKGLSEKFSSRVMAEKYSEIYSN